MTSRNRERIAMAVVAVTCSATAFFLGVSSNVGRDNTVAENAISSLNRCGYDLRGCYDEEIKLIQKRADHLPSDLRDCEDGLAMALHVWHDFPGHEVPGFRFLNPEGEVVTYHLPPERKRTGSLHIGPDTVHREAGHVDPTK